MGDYTNIINSAAEEAHAIGKAEGLAKGREEQNLMNAKKLKALGVSVEIIAQATDLPAETINKL